VTNRTYYALGKQVSPIAGQNRLFVNRGNANGWIKVQLQGTRSNRDGLGARIKVVAGDLVQYHELQSAHGYNSTNDPVMTFGLGTRKTVDRIEIIWPSGITQVVEAPATRRKHLVVEPAP
jgi:hypothetical protein